MSGVHGKKSNQHGNVSSYSRVPEGTIPVEGIKSFSWWPYIYRAMHVYVLTIYTQYNWSAIQEKGVVGHDGVVVVVAIYYST